MSAAQFVTLDTLPGSTDACGRPALRAGAAPAGVPVPCGAFAEALAASARAGTKWAGHTATLHLCRGREVKARRVLVLARFEKVTYLTVDLEFFHLGKKRSN